MDSPIPTEIKLHQKSRVTALRFSDGHSTGIYKRDYLYGLGANREAMWAAYLKRMEEAGAKRE